MIIRTSRWLVGACFWISLGVVSGARAADKSAPLPIKRIRLYETGVGYFERSGTLQNGSELTLSVPPGHLDDTLKSLVVLGGNDKTRISGLEFRSRESQSLAQADAGLENVDTSSIDFATALAGFKGAEVEVKAGARALRGRLTDVIPLDKQAAERCVAPSAGQTTCVEVKAASIVVLSASGELARAELASVSSVRALEPAVAARMTRALAGVSQRASSERPILRLHGASSAPITLGYIAEAPVWRVSYRVVLGDGGEASRVQGWALVHNDSDEPWQQVKLELVNGRPTSFLYPLAAPRYAERQLITPDAQLSTVPQLLAHNPDDMWTGNGTTVSESFGYGAGSGVSLHGVGVAGGGSGSGSGSLADVASDVVNVGNLADLAGASGVEGATQFRYSPNAPIDVAAHSSALVPFLNEAIALEPITWFGAPGEPGESAVRLSNNTTQTLPAGVASVFAEAGFAGETLLPRAKPGELRVLRFGVDLDVELEQTGNEESSKPEAYSYVANVLREHLLKSSQLAFRIQNKSGRPRTVCLALEIVENARVTGADAVGYDSALARAVLTFKVPAHGDMTRQVDASQAVMRNLNVDALSWYELRDLARAESVPAATRAILANAADEAYALDIRAGALPKRQAELEQQLKDIERLEGHVRALSGVPSDAHLAASELSAAEARLTALRARVATLTSEIGIYQARKKTALAALGKGGR